MTPQEKLEFQKLNNDISKCKDVINFMLKTIRNHSNELDQNSINNMCKGIATCIDAIHMNNVLIEDLKRNKNN